VLAQTNKTSRNHKNITFDSKETVLELNGCRIEAYPSNHIDAYPALNYPNSFY
jgi:hypothetical protein